MLTSTSHPFIPVQDPEREPGVPVQRGAGVRRWPRERHVLHRLRPRLHQLPDWQDHALRDWRRHQRGFSLRQSATSDNVVHDRFAPPLPRAQVPDCLTAIASVDKDKKKMTHDQWRRSVKGL